MVTGNGPNLEQAKRAAQGEAAERYSLVFQGTEQTFRAAYADIRDIAIACHELSQFSDEQHENRDAWNLGQYGFPYIPPPCPDHHPICWTAVYSLSHDEQRLAPTQHCYFASAKEDEILFAAADTNGCAAGPDLRFAIEHATLELLERDAIADWWLTRRRVPPAPFPDNPEAHDIRETFTADNRDVHLLDITSNLAIPVAAATAHDRSTGGRISMGFGAGPHLEHAAMRALRELRQGFRQPEDDPEGQKPNSSARAHGRWVQRATVATDPYIVPNPLSQRRTATQWTTLTELHRYLHSRKIDLYVLNLTRPETGIPVVRVLCPQLRPPHHRLRGFRVADVNPAPFAL